MPDKKAKDTVRAREKGTQSSTQRYLPVAEIRNNTLILKNGGLRAVLEIEAVNFNLKSETEQQGIIAGYGAFMNTLEFPVQIVIRSTRTNIDDYLTQVREIGEKHANELLKNQTLAYAAFMQKLIEMANIMQKRFYVIIPMDHMVRQKTIFEQFFDWIHPDDSSGKASVRTHEFTQAAGKLTERVDLVSSGLSNIGLHVKRLNTRDLIELLYQVYNPKTSQKQKIPKKEEDLNLEKNAL
ncbi:MAG TPA: TraC family protein [Candidatus Peribacteraceae bacterium]|nr:TraC family protein [Candidatus Peribacteraceae bacterium]